MDKKEAILLNYSMLTNELVEVAQEKVSFISSLFNDDPALLTDPELTAIAIAFRSAMQSIKFLDETINKFAREK